MYLPAYFLYLIMLNYLITGGFLICCAIGAGSIFMLSLMRKQFPFGFLSALLFMLVFHFMFGFYSLWGQFIIAYLVRPYISPEEFVRIMDIAILLGSPFLVVAWLMLIRFAWEFAGKTMHNIFIAVFLSAHAIVITGLIFYLRENPGIGLSTLLKYYYISACLIVTIIVLSRMPGRNKAASIHSNAGRNMSLGLSISAILQCILLLSYHGNIYLALLFILVFFASAGFIPVYLNYYGELRNLLPEGKIPDTLDDFCKKFEVSPREKEIIIEIFNGLSNQQIADKLFISLQTVKDHTHRIYGKTDVNSRVQLIKLVGEIPKLK
jgi:DNA-binding CsgD family transcriptional regulator